MITTDNIKDAKILIIGGYGVVGRLLYKALIEAGYRNVSISDKAFISERMHLENVNENWNLPDISPDNFYQCNLASKSDYDTLLKAVEGKDIVINLAAALETLSVDEIKNSNILGAQNVFNACREKSIKKVIIASSIMAIWDYLANEPYKSIFEGNYHDIKDIPPIPAEIRDSCDKEKLKLFISKNLDQVYAYIDSKIQAEKMAKEFAEKSNAACIAMRLGQINSGDDPKKYPGVESVFFSHADALAFVLKCIESIYSAPPKTFKIYFGTSDNKNCFVDIKTPQIELGWHPEDRENKKLLVQENTNPLKMTGP